MTQVLELFNHPFVLRLYTTFQDANRVYFLTELLQGGELWSIIYEAASGFESGQHGLSTSHPLAALRVNGAKHIAFSFCASVVL